MYGRTETLRGKEKYFLITAVITCATYLYYHYFHESDNDIHTFIRQSKQRRRSRVLSRSSSHSNSSTSQDSLDEKQQSTLIPDKQETVKEEEREREGEYKGSPQLEPLKFRSRSYTTVLKPPAPRVTHIQTSKSVELSLASN